jgi:CHAD domain-containing protein
MSGRTRSHNRRRKNGAGQDGCLLLSRVLEDRRLTFEAQLARCQRRATEPAIHDLRVATRRLIAVMDLADGIVARDGGGRERRALRRYLKGFNALRDVHVQLIAVRKLQRSFRSLGAYQNSLRLRERQLLRETGRHCGSLKTEALHGRVQEVQNALLTIGTHPALAAAARAAILGAAAGAFARVAAMRQHIAPDDPRSIHRLRVAFKKFRYILEILSPLLPWVTPGLRKAMNGFQTAMGEVQDNEVFLAAVNAYAALPRRMPGPSLLDVREFLARRKRETIEAFVQRADEAYRYWR